MGWRSWSAIGGGNSNIFGKFIPKLGQDSTWKIVGIYWCWIINIYLLGGGNSNIFWEFSSRSLGKWSNLTSIFFRWVGEKPPTSHIVVVYGRCFFLRFCWGTKGATSSSELGASVIFVPRSMWQNMTRFYYFLYMGYGKNCVEKLMRSQSVVPSFFMEFRCLFRGRFHIISSKTGQDPYTDYKYIERRTTLGASSSQYIYIIHKSTNQLTHRFVFQLSFGQVESQEKTYQVRPCRRWWLDF